MLMGALRVLWLGVLALAAAGSLPTQGSADDLVMPYACEMDHGTPRLLPAAPLDYPIIGHREDLPFTTCRSSSTDACETMMVHKFTIECAGQKVLWAKVAASGQAMGIALPAHLPKDFAPISRFRGRFVLPGFGHTTHLPTVAKQTLSADSVIETSSITPHSDQAHWVTFVDPAAKASAPGGAFRVAGVISVLLVSLMAGCLFVARRRVPLSYAFMQPEHSSERPGQSLSQAAKRVYRQMAGVIRRRTRSRSKSSAKLGDDGHLAKSLSVVHARLVETELLVATLPADLLLRDVLQTEIDALHGRAADISRRADQLGSKRCGALLKAIMRDLDRITRIVHGTSRRDGGEASASADPPSSVFEAYRVLGLNAEAPPAAVKKVVDALRMSWHPDHARSEADRRHREERIKQINAAWDILKNAQAAA
jgi:hypothetical protein